MKPFLELSYIDFNEKKIIEETHYFEFTVNYYTEINMIKKNEINEQGKFT